MAKFLRLDDVVQPAAVLFGARLKKRREDLGLTQGQLFEQTGITAAYISQIERAQANPTLDMMVKLAQAVGLEAWDMIRPEGENQDEK
ncbi:MAG: helix-turn-helix transcriptional regulator [Novosphingobium aromaticivorans]|nr:helix-turn-helix transcriptional regulator [Novosphingobium aromaticivorans]